jgi:hypothetical protein
MTLSTASLISESVRSDLELFNDLLCCCFFVPSSLFSSVSLTSAWYPTDEPTGGVEEPLPPSLLVFMSVFMLVFMLLSVVSVSFISRGRARGSSPVAEEAKVTEEEARGEVGEEVEEAARGEVGDEEVADEEEDDADAMEAEKLAAITLP